MEVSNAFPPLHPHRVSYTLGIHSYPNLEHSRTELNHVNNLVAILLATAISCSKNTSTTYSGGGFGGGCGVGGGRTAAASGGGGRAELPRSRPAAAGPGRSSLACVLSAAGAEPSSPAHVPRRHACSWRRGLGELPRARARGGRWARQVGGGGDWNCAASRPPPRRRRW